MNSEQTENQANLEGKEEHPLREETNELADKVRPYILRLWKFKIKYLVVNFIIVLVTILILVFLANPYFKSTAVILPEYGSKASALGQLSGFAAIAGVSTGEATPTLIYQNLVLSESVLRPVIYQKYLTESFKDSVNLIQYFGIQPDLSLPKHQQKRVMFLNVFNDLSLGKVVAETDPKTMILSVAVTMPESKLSADVVNKIIESLDEYVRTKRKSFANEQRYYIDMRVKQIKDSLYNSEMQLKNFREQNRIIAQSPNLLLEQTRLLRNVDILQGVYVELTKQLEVAKIDEIKDTPVVNLREIVNDPVRKAGPKKAVILFAVTVFFGFITAAYFMFIDDIKRYLYLFVRKPSA